MNRKYIFFVIFLVLSSVAYRFIDTSLKITTFNITHSKSLTSLVPVISALSFISLGMVSGIVVDAFSRKFFVTIRLIVIFFTSLSIYFLYQYKLVNIVILFAFVLLMSTFRTFSSSSEASIFYDICGSDNLEKKIGYKSIALQISAMLSSFVITLFIGKEQQLMVVASFLTLVCYMLFREINYKDCNKKQQFNSTKNFSSFVYQEFIRFVKMTWSHDKLKLMLIISFLKTFFVFWAMTSGALFKFGIENSETKYIYFTSMIFMDIISIITTFFVSKKRKLNLNTFLWGILITGLGIFIIGIVKSVLFLILGLAIMYIGLAISQIANSFIYRMELPENQRTQGLSFSVFPYYFADICSGSLFSFLLIYFSVNDLLVASGVALVVIFFIFIRKNFGLEK